MGKESETVERVLCLNNGMMLQRASMFWFLFGNYKCGQTSLNLMLPVKQFIFFHWHYLYTRYLKSAFMLNDLKYWNIAISLIAPTIYKYNIGSNVIIL